MIRTARHTVHVLLFILALSTIVRGQDSALSAPAIVDFGGYIKQLTILHFARSIDSVFSDGILENRLRLTVQLQKNIPFHIEARTRLFYGESIKLATDKSMIVGGMQGANIEPELWVRSHSLALQTVFDRVYVDVLGEQWALRAGRQLINWGINTVWTPNDIFNSYNLFDFDYEERPGTNAVKLRYDPQPGLSLEAASEVFRDGGNVTAAIRALWNIAGYDLQLIGGTDAGGVIVGGGFAGNVWDAGFKGECSYFGATSDSRAAGSATLTLDHVIGGYYLTLSGLYCSDAPTTPTSGAALFDAPRSARELMPFRYTLYASAMKSFTPLFSATVSAMYSPTFHSVILFPSISYSLAENVDADLTIESYFNDATGPFAAIANALFLRVRLSL